MEKEQNRERCTNPRIGDLFLFYLNSDVTTLDQKRIETHLAECSSCRKELAFVSKARTITKKHALKLG